MITLRYIETWAEKQWLGVLKARLKGESFFPKRVLDHNKVKDERLEFHIYEELRTNAKKVIDSDRTLIQKPYGYTCYLVEKGQNKGAVNTIEFVTLEDYLSFCDRERDFADFCSLSSRLIERFPQLKDWLTHSPGKVLDPDLDWQGIVSVLQFFIDNPKPNLYLRELLLPVDTKFIEHNRALLDTLLELVLPDEAIDGEEEIFEKKYGLQWVEPLIRICFLDSELQISCDEHDGDFGLPISALATRDWPVQKVLVVENLTTLVSLRDRGLPNVLGLHGHGYRIANFKDLEWLRHCEVYYWGDIDVQGFEILSLFRQKFRELEIKSVLMDEATIRQAPENSKGTGKPSGWKKEPSLDEQAEIDAYLWAKDGWRQIEQEHLPMEEVVMPKLREIFYD